MGRRFLLTPDIIQEIKGILSTGIDKSAAFKVISARLNVHPQTLRAYHRNGRSISQFLENDPSMRLARKEKLLLEFYNAVENSPSVAEYLLAKEALNAALSGDTKVLMFILERRYASTWSKKSAVFAGQAEEEATPGSLFVSAYNVLLGDDIDVHQLPVIDDDGNIVHKAGTPRYDIKKQLEAELNIKPEDE